MKRVFPRIGRPVLCGKCGKDRLFGYGPCGSCGDVPNKAAVDRIREQGVAVDETGKVQGEFLAGLFGPGECGGLSCTPAMEDKMQPMPRASMSESMKMQRGMARNGRVIRKSDTMS